MKNFISYSVCVLLIIFALNACKKEKKAAEFPDVSTHLNYIAEQYVIQALNLGKYDENYIDAYFGPDYLKISSESQSLQLDSIVTISEELLAELNAIPTHDSTIYRIHNLQCFITAMISHADYLRGKEFSFDEESEAIYGVKSPHYDTLYYKAICDKIDSLLPAGKGSISERYEIYKNAFIVPNDRIDTVFTLAINEARRRTKEHYQLQSNERFTSEYVTGKPWGAYNWYQGNSNSLIQVNTELPFEVNKAVSLACHEGYPGHHVFHSLIEETFVKNKSWVEYSVYPLFSPLSLVSEGTANAGISIAFPEADLLAFETEILLPAAGIDTTGYTNYKKILKLLGTLDYISNDAARYYLDGQMTREETVAYLVRYGCRSRERASMNIDFYTTYRSYVVNYNLGQDIVEQYINKFIGNSANPVNERWEVFYKLISMPIMPKDLIKYGK